MARVPVVLLLVAAPAEGCSTVRVDSPAGGEADKRRDDAVMRNGTQRRKTQRRDDPASHRTSTWPAFRPVPGDPPLGK
eukprot:gene16371-10730_t